MSHNDDSIPANAYTSVDDKAGVEGVDDMQSLDDSKDDEDVNEQVDVEDNVTVSLFILSYRTVLSYLVHLICRLVWTTASCCACCIP